MIKATLSTNRRLRKSSRWLWTFISIIAASASGAILPRLDLKSLASKADLVVVGRVVEVHDLGRVTIHTADGDIAGRSQKATLRIERVLKGADQGPVLRFSFVMPEVPSQYNYAPIAVSQFGTFFLRQSEDWEILDPYYPYVVATPGAPLRAGSVLDQVVGELAAVINSESCPVEEQREAVYDLDPTPGAVATAALIRAARRSDPVMHFDSMAELLGRNDLSYLPEAVGILLQPPAGTEPTLIMNLAYAIGAGISSPNAVQALAKLLSAPGRESRRAAAQALARIGAGTIVRPLSLALEDSDREVRYWGVVGLARFTGQNHWYPSIAEYREKEDLYLKHWRDWAHSDIAADEPK